MTAGAYGLLGFLCHPLNITSETLPLLFFGPTSSCEVRVDANPLHFRRDIPEVFAAALRYHLGSLVLEDVLGSFSPSCAAGLDNVVDPPWLRSAEEGIRLSAPLWKAVASPDPRPLLLARCEPRPPPPAPERETLPLCLLLCPLALQAASSSSRSSDSRLTTSLRGSLRDLAVELKADGEVAVEEEVCAESACGKLFATALARRTGRSPFEVSAGSHGSGRMRGTPGREDGVSDGKTSALMFRVSENSRATHANCLRLRLLLLFARVRAAGHHSGLHSSFSLRERHAPEEVVDPKQLPLVDTVALHRLKVPPRTLLVHNGTLQLLQDGKGGAENVHYSRPD
ncbi:hypothetical protein EYF80_025261 [Liparis tanakae]|uniref:Uncharacterized protein n=1 Tax=Liparis tanakae TaxID=230148 RepID=A0A4Z2HHU0_9TELE|nr:hypothetical protein EYF80_025261 [Liparis tanakae]